MEAIKAVSGCHTKPTPAMRKPKNIVSGIKGRMQTLAMKAIKENCQKYARVTGRTEAWAARVTTTVERRNDGRRASLLDPKAWRIAGARYTIPKRLMKESRKPGSKRSPGFMAIMIAAAQASAWPRLYIRPL